MGIAFPLPAAQGTVGCTGGTKAFIACTKATNNLALAAARAATAKETLLASEEVFGLAAALGFKKALPAIGLFASAPEGSAAARTATAAAAIGGANATTKAEI